ncbi:hypothetical protein GB937_010876 [Aspergillus fischeri]|nr:hypothetical protein GB937_010876 [Aspergillus fischeri]
MKRPISCLLSGILPPLLLLKRIGSPTRPEIKSRYSRRYNHERAKCEDPKVIQEWFDQLHEVISQHGILEDDIFNFDERGFAMGLIATTKVVTRSNMPGKPHLLQPGNREWVTTIECINAKGWSIPTCIIFNGKVHIEGWYQDYALPSDWRIEVSENGWTTDEIGLRWLPKVFIPATTSRTIGRYRLLILDGHGNHLTPAFDKACRDNNIVAIYFLKAYPEAHGDVFKPGNIKNGFLAAGISSNSTIATPHNILQLGKQASSIKKPLKQGSHSPSSPSKRALEQLIKGCEIALHSAALLAKENHDLRLANEKEKQKRKRSRRQMTPNEGLYTGS